MPRHSAPRVPSRMRPRLAVTLVVAAAGLATAVWLPTRNDSADAAERGRGFGEQRDTFADEFDGEAGSSVNPQLWALVSGRDRDARLDGEGNLVLTARESRRGGVTSATLVTRDAVRRESGRIETRVRVPEGRGLRPALELTGPDRGGRSLDLLAGAQPGDFRTYAVTWTPESVTATVDGEQVQRFEVPPGATDRAFGLALSLKVTAEGQAELPARMIVDFVRVTPVSPPSSSPPPSAPPSEEPSAPPSGEPSAPPSSEAPVTPDWKTFVKYEAGDVVHFEDAEYKVLEAHTSLPGWEPTALPALFEKL